MMIAVITLISANATAQTLRDAAREQARRDPNVTLQLPAPPGHFVPKSIEDLTRESDVVLMGKLVRNGSYLGSKEDRILTDYHISDVVVIAGRLSVRPGRVPGQTTPTVVTVWGGDVTVEGVRMRGNNQDFAPVQDRREYLLFLKPSPVRGVERYQITQGGLFEVLDQQLKPLLKRGNTVFAWAIESPLSELTARIRASGKDH